MGCTKQFGSLKYSAFLLGWLHWKHCQALDFKDECTGNTEKPGMPKDECTDAAARPVLVGMESLKSQQGCDLEGLVHWKNCTLDVESGALKLGGHGILQNLFCDRCTETAADPAFFQHDHPNESNYSDQSPHSETISYSMIIPMKAITQTRAYPNGSKYA